MGRSAAAVAAPARTRRAPVTDTPARRRSGHATPAPAPARRSPRVVRSPFARTLRTRAGQALDSLLAGRGWIVLVFLLLGGIVFFNVDLLQMNRDIARNSEKISALKRENAGLRADEARLASSERIQEEAAALGLVLPAPGEVRYLKARPSVDARRAAGGIAPADGAAADTAAAEAGAVPAPGDEAATESGVDPVTGFPVDPATGQPVYDPVTGAPLDPSTGEPLDLSALGAEQATDPAAG
jgi:cell division protein FtsL